MSREKRKCAVKASERILNMHLGPLVGRAPETIDKEGYIVLRSAIEISPEEFTDLLQYSKPKNSPIFNYSTSRPSDGKRLQSSIPRAHPIFKRIISVCKSVLPRTCPKNPVVITSLAGCQEQISTENFPTKKIINLERGDALIFRGDLIHAGSAYEMDNVRLHCYLDVPGTKRNHDQTFPFNLFPSQSLKEHVSH